MGKTKMLIISMLIGGMMLGATSAFANGYPFGIVSTSSSSKTIVVGKFSTQFTQQEAQNFTAAVVSLVGANAQGTAIYTPNVLASYGITDADLLKMAVRSAYKSQGFSTFIFLDIKKTAEYVAGYGSNIRIDIYLPTGNGVDFAYLLSIETSQSLLHSFGLL